MKSIIGILLKIILTLVVIGALAFFALSYFANPERLRVYAVDYVNQKYQRTLALGDIHWRVFPKLGISLDDVSLSDSALFGKKTFASMKTISVFVDTMALLRGHVDVKTVELVDLKANLKTNVQGVNNWDDLASTPTTVKTPAPVSTGKSAKASKVEPAVASSATDASDKGLSITDLTFNIEKIDIKNGEFNYKNDKEGATYKIKDISFEGQDIALDQSFPVSLKFAISSSAPAMAATVSAKAQLKIAMKNGAFDPSGVTLNGTVDVPSLSMQGLTITSLKAPVAMANNVIKLDSMSAAFYSGTLGGTATIDASTVPTRVALNYDVKGVQMGPMLRAMGSKESFTGTLNMKGNIGFKSAAVKKQMMQSLDGKAKMNIQRGMLKGVDLAYFYSVGSNLLDPKRPVPARPNTGNTEFATTTANVVINKGILTNNDLVILNSGIYGAGAGTINLVSDQIDYRFRIQGVNNGQPVGNVIPLQIRGSTSNPNISIDMSIVKERIIDEVKSNVGQQIFKALGR